MIWTILLAWLAFLVAFVAIRVVVTWNDDLDLSDEDGQRFASDFPLIYYDAQPHEWERLN